MKSDYLPICGKKKSVRSQTGSQKVIADFTNLKNLITGEIEKIKLDGDVN